MKHLNDIKGFQGMIFISDGEDYCKVSIATRGGIESFWVSDLEKTETGMRIGSVDNDLILSDWHGLNYGDRVSFELIE